MVTLYWQSPIKFRGNQVEIWLVYNKKYILGIAMNKEERFKYLAANVIIWHQIIDLKYLNLSGSQIQNHETISCGLFSKILS